MITNLLKKLLPHLVALLVFVVIAAIYCKPSFEGKVVNQHDIQGWQGMARQSFEFKQQHGHMPYWTNSMFGGMPAYQIAFETPNKISLAVLHDYFFTLGLPKPANFFVLACITTYFLLMVLRVNPWVGMMGGIAYAYSTYDPIIIAVGHDTKMICIGYAPAVLGSLLLVLRKQYFAGTILTALFAALMLSFNHFQIIYYTLIFSMGIFAGYIFFHDVKKQVKHVVVSIALAMVAGAVALGVNIVSIWPTMEFAKETMRGGHSELTGTSQSNKSSDGLDKDYAFGWSYGISESFTFLVPGIYGGGSSGNQLQPGNSKFVNQLRATGMPVNDALDYAAAYAYWGPQPGTSGPVYLGAVICFLFIVALAMVKHWIKWGIVAVSLFALVLAWGRNLPGINYFLFDHMPLYNKFRAPSMALVIPQLGFVLLACLALQEIFFGTTAKTVLWKNFRLSFGITAVVFLLLSVMYIHFNYSGNYDAALKRAFYTSMLQETAKGQTPTAAMQQQAGDVATLRMNGLTSDRKALFGNDLLRSCLLVILSGILIALYCRDKLKPQLALAGVIFLCSADIIMVGWRYLNHGSFVEAKEFASVFIPTGADLTIKADPDPHYRVYDQASNDPFSDSRASYFHNSIGGYNPAKLAYYQDIIQRQLLKGNKPVFDMLNTKYFIVPNAAGGEPEARLNPEANGNAWLVKGIRLAKNADEEMDLLGRLNLKDSAVIDKRYKEMIGTVPVFDTAASVTLVKNSNDTILYKYKANSPQFAVFSEIYYPYGWNAYIDGKPSSYCRVNYVLRGMPVPAGVHAIEFRFEPRSVILGSKLSMWFSLLLYIMLLAGLVAALVRTIKSYRTL